MKELDGTAQEEHGLKSERKMEIIKNYLNTILLTACLMSSDALSKVNYIHTDFMGSPAVLTNEAGEVISRSHYRPFGDSIEGIQQDIGYTGHQHDAELGLTYMQARYYDPAIGRFYSNDPVSFVPSDITTFNRYSYVGNNPYKFVDPDGKNRVLVLAARFVKEPVRTTRSAARVIRRTLEGAGMVQPVMNEVSESEPASDVPRPPVVIDDKIAGQLDERGWTVGEVEEVANGEPIGKSVDKRSPNKTPDGQSRDDTASVYGSKDGGHVVVNDRTGEVVQVSNKNNPDWAPDGRIKWNEVD